MIILLSLVLFLLITSSLIYASRFKVCDIVYCTNYPWCSCYGEYIDEIDICCFHCHDPGDPLHQPPIPPSDYYCCGVQDGCALRP